MATVILDGSGCKLHSWATNISPIYLTRTASVRQNLTTWTKTLDSCFDNETDITTSACTIQHPKLNDWNIWDDAILNFVLTPKVSRIKKIREINVYFLLDRLASCWRNHWTLSVCFILLDGTQLHVWNVVATVGRYFEAHRNKLSFKLNYVPQ